MKKIILLLIVIYTEALSAQINIDTKLYYACKIWGYTKYYHSEVSDCKVNWDSVLMVYLPQIKTAGTVQEFNDVIMNLLNSAGEMEIASTPRPEELSKELSYNLNFEWFNDEFISNGVRNRLLIIKENYRPHKNCMVSSGNGWLKFTQDDPIIDRDLSLEFPNENERLMILFKFWNIINYFSPYNDIIDTPWDSTLYHFINDYISALDYATFAKTIKMMVSKLDDTHADGSGSSVFKMYGSYVPKIILRYIDGSYIIVKSAYDEIKKGDVIHSINGLTTKQWEDSLRQYISAGNETTFRYNMCYRMCYGDSSSFMSVKLYDSEGNLSEHLLQRNWNNDSFFSYHPCDSLLSVKYMLYNGNIGYVNMGLLSSSNVVNMYNTLYQTKAIIFDIRNYPRGTMFEIGDYMFPNKTIFAKLTLPDVNYPGTFNWSDSFIGKDNNPIAYKGKVIILCNHRAISHAEYNIMAFRAFPGAVVIGSQTVGADGNVTWFDISPDIRINFTNLGVFYSDGTPTQRIGIVPDIEVYPTVEGIRQNRDEVLEKAFEIANTTSYFDGLTINENQLIYPNPSAESIIVPIESINYGKIYIYNTIINCIKEIVIDENFNSKIDISELQNGIYILQYGFKYYKFIKF